MSRKLIAALVGVCMLGIVSGARAEDGAMPAKKNVLTTNVLNLIVATFSAEYEYISSPKMGIYGTARYGSFEIGDFDVSWPGASVGVHFYPSGRAPEGMYWGPLLYFNLMSTTFSRITINTTSWPWTTTTTEEDASAAIFGPMVELGTRWNMGGFILALGGQVGFLMGTLESSWGDEVDYGGFAWGLNTNIGFCF